VPTSLGPSASCGASLLPCWPQQDLVDGQAARTAEDEGDDLGDDAGVVDQDIGGAELLANAVTASPST
jgi:hypothetical protein